VRLGEVTQRYVVCVSALGVLVAKSAHRVTGVATFILLADIGIERWFRSHNVIPIERWRARRIVRQSNDDPAAA
jgi:hypothetical protein